MGIIDISLKPMYTHRPKYSGTSLLRSPTGLGKGDRNGEVTILQGELFALWNIIWD